MSMLRSQGWFKIEPQRCPLTPRIYERGLESIVERQIESGVLPLGLSSVVRARSLSVLYLGGLGH